VVLSRRSLPYAKPGLQSLLTNSLEPLDIVLLTDTTEDLKHLNETVSRFTNLERHRVQVVMSEELADSEASLFRGRPTLRAFRHGHPCWRKITDPLLVGAPGEELVILDPDLYFPNRFRFEQTPERGLLLMWQQPNCLVPPEVVTFAMANGIRLARHVDIGVAHWRSAPDLDWLEWMLGKLTGTTLPNVMHIEAIVWAAIAMREGGGHLNPRYWRCWRRTVMKRLMRKLGVDGGNCLRSEPWREIKCFHAGGEAKWWVVKLERRGFPGEPKEHSQAAAVIPFVELTSTRYAREQTCKRLLRGLDVYGILH